MSTYTSKAIRKVLEDFGLPVHSVRKKKRMEGGNRYDFHGGLRQGSCKGTPYWFFQVDLQSNPGVTEEDYDIAAIVLEEAGYSDCRHAAWIGLRIELPEKMQMKLRFSF